MSVIDPALRNGSAPARLKRAQRANEIIPATDHHAIRMSSEPNREIAERYRCSPKAVQTIRAGGTGSRLTREERHARVLRNAGPGTSVPFRLADCLLLIGSARGDGLADQDRQEAKDAAWECSACGRLPHDLTPVCVGCSVSA